MLEDKLLIWKFKRGSNEALCRIYQKYGDYLLALAAALLKDVNATEDVLHDVFCRFIESREKLKLAGSLKSYLGTCVVNLARDRLRARKLQVTAAEMNGPEHYAIFGEEARSLNYAITQLTFEQREVIMLHLRGGMKFRQIASLQGISINTVKSRYRYGLEKLRATLSDEDNKNEIS
ncbi:MAG: RNA polymerase sigma factor [Planctomycetota bacterium]|jgi:RNA polymerase sigma-70 factor (ECF subfamily)